MQKKFLITLYQLGSDWEIQYLARKKVKHLEKLILKKMKNFCDLFSRFIPDSLLSQLNRKRKLKVNQEFIKLFEKADFFYHITKGIFNPLATPAHFGYTQSFDTGIFTIPSEQTPNLNWNEIKRDGDIICLAPGQILDFGGIGKGYLIDELAIEIRKHSNHFMINGGGDIWTEGGKSEKTPWNIAIDNPVTGDISGVISQFTGAIATSGTTKRQWREYHHLISNECETPAKNIPKSLTVTAGSTTLADIGATTMICSPSTEYSKIAHKLKLEYGYYRDGDFLHTEGLRVRCKKIKFPF